MKSTLEIYALSVCFVAVVCFVVSLAMAGFSLFEIGAPKLSMNAYEYDRYQTNEAYWKSLRSYLKDREKFKAGEEELTKQRIEAFSIAIKSEQRSGIQSLILYLIFIFFSGITLIIHWKIAKKSRKVCQVPTIETETFGIEESG